METILLVEDEQPIRHMLGFALTRAGYRTLEAGDARQAQCTLSETQPDLILMDWMLPDATGIELIRNLKRDKFTSNIPVIMLTAKTTEEDKITGLNSGADDYVSKPFSPKELIARIQAVLRRNTLHKKDDEVLTTLNLRLDKASHRVTVDDNLLELGPTEFRLLNFLMENPNRVYSRGALLDHVWGRNTYVEERTVDVHILRLRKSLAPWQYDKLIQTVRGVGYRLSSTE
jgi:two-component system phosphate regulon response regulator PhoB